MSQPQERRPDKGEKRNLDRTGGKHQRDEKEQKARYRILKAKYEKVKKDQEGRILWVFMVLIILGLLFAFGRLMTALTR